MIVMLGASANFPADYGVEGHRLLNLSFKIFEIKKAVKKTEGRGREWEPNMNGTYEFNESNINWTCQIAWLWLVAERPKPSVRDFETQVNSL